MWLIAIWATDAQPPKGRRKDRALGRVTRGPAP